MKRNEIMCVKCLAYSLEQNQCLMSYSFYFYIIQVFLTATWQSTQYFSRPSVSVVVVVVVQLLKLLLFFSHFHYILSSRTQKKITNEQMNPDHLEFSAMKQEKMFVKAALNIILQRLNARIFNLSNRRKVVVQESWLRITF